MSYFVIQVKTKGEAKYLQLANNYISASGMTEKGELLFPQRKLRVRKRGIVRDSLLPLYPGYVFYHGDEVETPVYWILRKIPGFFRFLKAGKKPEPLTGEDEKILIHFLSFGEVIESSKVYFDINNKIRVVSGPMTGLEGRIVKVDKRKKRAKVRLSLYEDSFLVDFGFELLEQAGQ